MLRDFWRSFWSFLVITPVAFALHFIWETLHIPLYTNDGDISVLPLALYAALGDVFYTLLAVACIALYKRDAGWMRRSAGRGLRAHITARFVRRRIGRVQSDAYGFVGVCAGDADAVWSWHKPAFADGGAFAA